MRLIGNCNEYNCIITLGKPCDRVVVAGLVMSRNSSLKVVSVYSGLSNVT